MAASAATSSSATTPAKPGTRKAPIRVTLLHQHLAHPAVSAPLAGYDAPITWPAETDLSIMGRDRGAYDVMGPGGVPCSSDFSIMGRDRGTYDVMAPGGF